MELKIKAPKTIEDGSHTGKVSKLEYRHEPFEYFDVHVATESESGDTVDLKYGCALGEELVVTKGTKLGKLLVAFGADLKPDTKIEPEDYIKVGQKVKFMTIRGESGFSDIVEGSLKPLK
jgi:hypothetical protein